MTARQTVRDFAVGSLTQWDDEVSVQVPSPVYLGKCQLKRNVPGDRAAQTRQRKFSRRKAGVTARNMMAWPGIPDARSCSLSPNAYPSSIMSSSPNDATPRRLPNCKFCGDCAALSCNRRRHSIRTCCHYMVSSQASPVTRNCVLQQTSMTRS